MADTETNPSQSPTCPTCGKTDFPVWNDKGECITCARDRVLGTTPDAGLKLAFTCGCLPPHNSLAEHEAHRHPSTPTLDSDDGTTTDARLQVPGIGNTASLDMVDKALEDYARTTPTPGFQGELNGLCQALWDSAVQATREGFKRDADVYPADITAAITALFERSLPERDNTDEAEAYSYSFGWNAAIDQMEANLKGGGR